MAGKRRGHGEGLIYKDQDGRWRGVVDLGWRDGVVEAVLAGFEGAVSSEAEESEGVAAADDAVFPQKRGDGGGAGAGRDVDEGFGRRAVGGVDDVGGCCDGEEEKKQEYAEKLQICASRLGP